MRFSGPLGLFAGLAVLLAAIAALQLLPGSILLSKHEGDTLHLMDILMRMQDGQRIHEDFMTPLGILSLAPFLWMMQAGLVGATALIAGQVLVAALLLPLIAWVCASRLSPVLAWTGGLYLLILATALIDGGTDTNTALSMSYNRWAWVLAYLALLPTLLPLATPQGRAADGLVIGLCVALLVLVKITYAVALFPAVLLGLVLRRNWRGLGLGVLAGLAVAALATLWLGPGFWLGYVADLKAVSASPLRTWPSEPIDAIVSSPGFLLANLLVIGSVALLRQSGARDEGLLLLLLLPAFIYIVAQNFGNDPQWLVLLALVLLSLLPMEKMRNGFGMNLRLSGIVLAVAALTMTLPSVQNLATSTGRHFGADLGKAEPMVPGNPRMAGLLSSQLRLYSLHATIEIYDHDPLLVSLREKSSAKPLARLNGEELPWCEGAHGLQLVTQAMAEDLTARGHGGKAIWVADLFNLLWFYGDFPALKGVAPWTYGGIDGAEQAEMVLVPLCPVSPGVQADVLKTFEQRGTRLTEVERTGLYVLLATDKGQPDAGTAPLAPEAGSDAPEQPASEPARTDTPTR